MPISTEKIYNCKRHGLTIGYTYGTRVSCWACHKKYLKEYHEKTKQNKLLHKKNFDYYSSKNILYNCSAIYCIPCDKQWELSCVQCDGRWTKVQQSYLLAFKPQKYKFSWNQI